MMASETTEDFGCRVTDILNHGALNVAIGLGYRVGLFEALDQAETPLTAEELAARASLHPRVVQEWLGVIVCGKIVEVDDDEKFWLPTHRGELFAFLLVEFGD